MKKFLEIYLMPKFWVSLKTVKLTRLTIGMDKKCYEKWNICKEFVRRHGRYDESPLYMSFRYWNM